MKKTIFTYTVFVFFIGFLACKKPAEKPPVTNLSGWTKYSVAQLKSIATCTNNCQKRFSSDAFLTGVVLADEVSGNFYKEIYVRDSYNTGGIHLEFKSGHCNFFIGDSVRINLKGIDVNLNEMTDMLEIDSIDFEKSMVKYNSGPAPQPKVISLSELSNSNPYSNYYCDLITVTGVGFISTDTAKIFADPVAQLSINRTVQDCAGNQLIVRTSNYASFAQEKTPKGFGSITGIATAYNGDKQMAIRHSNELNMNGTGCVVYLKKDFNDNSLTSGGWTQQIVINNNVKWSASTFGSATFAKISGYISGNQNAESWLISPAFDLSNAKNPVFSFITAAKFTGNELEVWASINYTSGLPGTANWTQLSGFNLSPNNPGNYAWTPSGSISLATFKNTNTRIAFKYQSTTAGSTTYEVDDILIKEN